MSLLFNTLSRFVIAFLPRSKLLLISYLQSPSTVILEPKGEKMKTVKDYFEGVPESLHMVIAAMKLKDTCSLEEKL